MASGKRASMREGPLAQLFRKTDEEEAANESPRSDAAPEAGSPVPEGDPAPRAARQAPERQAQRRAEEPASTRRTAEAESQAQDSFASRATEAARRAEERSERRRAERERPEESRVSRYEGVPTPEERLRSVFSSDIPENMMERAPEQESLPRLAAAVARLAAIPCCGSWASAAPASTPSTA